MAKATTKTRKTSTPSERAVALLQKMSIDELAKTAKTLAGNAPKTAEFLAAEITEIVGEETVTG